jgi:hypothetical protein
MPWPFADGHRRRIETEESVCSGADELSVGVDGFPRGVFDDVGFEQNRFSADVQIEEPECFVDELIEFVRVLFCTQDCNS